MRKVISLAKASGSFLGALFGRRDRKGGVSENGHSVLLGWEDAPEEKIIHAYQREAARAVPVPRTALFCHAGPHAGEVFFLGREQEKVGCSPLDEIVLTPEGAQPDAAYHFLNQGVTKIVADMGHSFKLNGATEHQAELFDFDELQLLGNRFLVLDVSATEGA